MPAKDLSSAIGPDDPFIPEQRRDTPPAEGHATTWHVIRTLRLRLARRLAYQDTPRSSALGDTDEAPGPCG